MTLGHIQGHTFHNILDIASVDGEWLTMGHFQGHAFKNILDILTEDIEWIPLGQGHNQGHIFKTYYKHCFKILKIDDLE